MPATGKRRALGQHFLRDASVIARIVDRTLLETRAAGCRALLEVGPGRGALTDPLLKALAAQSAGSDGAPALSLILAERDQDLAAHWTANMTALPGRLRVESGDFLELGGDRWLGEQPLGVVSNLPYSAGTAILTRLAKERTAIPFMVLMFQAEVARRIRAVPSTKAWGSLSLWIQNHWDVEKLCAVPPGAFAPPPEVDSEVIVLKRRATPRIPTPDEAAWEGLLRVAFAHRRKMLRSSFPRSGPYRNALELSGVDGTKRAEALEWDEWERLCKNLNGSG